MRFHTPTTSLRKFAWLVTIELPDDRMSAELGSHVVRTFRMWWRRSYWCMHINVVWALETIQDDLWWSCSMQWTWCSNYFAFCRRTLVHDSLCNVGVKLSFEFDALLAGSDLTIVFVDLRTHSALPVRSKLCKGVHLDSLVIHPQDYWGLEWIQRSISRDVTVE